METFDGTCYCGSRRQSQKRHTNEKRKLNACSLHGSSPYTRSASRLFLCFLKSAGCRHRLKLGRPLLLEEFGKQECKINRLLSVKPRIADRVIPIVEIGFRDGPRAAGTFSHILAGHLEVNATGVSALGLMYFEESADLFEDQVEGTSLVPGGRCDRVSMHRIAGPQYDPSFTL